MKIAILEDDCIQAQFIENILCEAGYQCETFFSSQLLFCALRKSTFDLLIVDWNLPDTSGLEVIERLAGRTERQVPIMMVTSRSNSNDLVRALRAGADDFISKPFTGDILLARIAAVARRCYANTPKRENETFGVYKFIKSKQALYAWGDCVKLTAREFELALLFFQNFGRALSRSYILETLWPRNPDITTRTLDTHVSRIRTKMNISPQGSGFRLSTMYGFGYRLDKVGVEDTG